MSSIEKDPQSDAVNGDISSFDGASGGVGDMRDSLHSKPRSGERYPAVMTVWKCFVWRER